MSDKLWRNRQKYLLLCTQIIIGYKFCTSHAWDVLCLFPWQQTRVCTRISDPILFSKSTITKHKARAGRIWNIQFGWITWIMAKQSVSYVMRVSERSGDWSYCCRLFSCWERVKPSEILCYFVVRFTWYIRGNLLGVLSRERITEIIRDIVVKLLLWH